MSIQRWELRRFVQMAVLVPILAVTSTALGQTKFWVADEGDWFVDSNWSDGRPDVNTNAQINNGGTARIFNPAFAKAVTLGFSSPNSGTLEVLGQASFDGLTVGRQGTGTLRIQGNVDNTLSGASIAASEGSTGTVTVTGVNSTWEEISFLTVGERGEGTLIVSDGGFVWNREAASIGQFSESVGMVTVTGADSVWQSDTPFRVGESGEGTLTIEDGGRVSATDFPEPGESIIGDAAGSTGTVTVTGAGSSWSNDNLVVGDEGEGTLMISGGGVSSIHGIIGRLAGSIGMVTVTGGGSWRPDRLSIGGDAVSGNDGGTGALTIGPEGTVIAGESIALFPDGLIKLEGGTLITAEVSFEEGGGQLEWISGRLQVDLWDGDLTNPTGGTFVPGRLGGSDTISGTVLGNYTQESDATLLIGIIGLTPGTEFSVLAVEGTATLDGTLDILVGFSPEIGDEFTVLTAESVVDNGLELGILVDDNLETGTPAASMFELVVDSTSVTLRTIATALPGDFNGDGTVDAADYTVWRDGLGDTFDQDDYDVWKNNFGMTAENGAGNAAAVSEPGAGILISVALCGVIAMRRRRRAGSAGAPSSRVALLRSLTLPARHAPIVAGRRCRARGGGRCRLAPPTRGSQPSQQRMCRCGRRGGCAGPAGPCRSQVH